MKRGTISAGMLVDADERPLASIKITAWLADDRNLEYAGRIETMSGADGRFEFQNLEPTVYRFSVSGGTVTEITPPIGDTLFSGKPVVRAGRHRVTVVVELRAYPKRGLTLSGEAKTVMKMTRLQRVRPLFG